MENQKPALELESETYWIVRYFHSVNDVWRRMQFQAGDRTYSEDEAKDTASKLRKYCLDVRVSKVTRTTTQEDVHYGDES